MENVFTSSFQIVIAINQNLAYKTTKMVGSASSIGYYTEPIVRCDQPHLSPQLDTRDPTNCGDAWYIYLHVSASQPLFRYLSHCTAY